MTEVTYAFSYYKHKRPARSCPGLNVIVLTPRKLKRESIEKEIRALDLPDVEKQIRVAELYAS
jgi:hypothetical protein